MYVFVTIVTPIGIGRAKIPPRLHRSILDGVRAHAVSDGAAITQSREIRDVSSGEEPKRSV